MLNMNDFLLYVKEMACNKDFYTHSLLETPSDKILVASEKRVFQQNIPPLLTISHNLRPSPMAECTRSPVTTLEKSNFNSIEHL